MKEVGNMLVADDGTTYYANCGIVGIGSELQVSQGYDGGFNYEGWDFTDGHPIKPEHRRELAEYMIGLWTRFRDEQLPQKEST